EREQGERDRQDQQQVARRRLPKVGVGQVVDAAQGAAPRAVDAGGRVERAQPPRAVHVGVADVERDRGRRQADDAPQRRSEPLRPRSEGDGPGRETHQWPDELSPIRAITTNSTNETAQRRSLRPWVWGVWPL